MERAGVEGWGEARLDDDPAVGGAAGSWGTIGKLAFGGAATPFMVLQKRVPQAASTKPLVHAVMLRTEKTMPEAGAQAGQ